MTDGSFCTERLRFAGERGCRCGDLVDVRADVGGGRAGIGAVGEVARTGVAEVVFDSGQGRVA